MSFASVDSFSSSSASSPTEIEDLFTETFNSQTQIAYDVGFNNEFLTVPFLGQESSLPVSLETTDARNCPIDPILLQLPKAHDENVAGTFSVGNPDVSLPTFPVGADDLGLNLNFPSGYPTLDNSMALDENLLSFNTGSVDYAFIDEQFPGVNHDPIFPMDAVIANAQDLALGMNTTETADGMMIEMENQQIPMEPMFQEETFWNDFTILTPDIPSVYPDTANLLPRPIPEADGAELQSAAEIYPSLDLEKASRTLRSIAPDYLAAASFSLASSEAIQSAPASVSPTVSSTIPTQQTSEPQFRPVTPPARARGRGRPRGRTGTSTQSRAADPAPSSAPAPISLSAASKPTGVRRITRRSKVNDPSVQAFYAVTGNSKKDQVAPSTRKETPEVMNQLARTKTREMTWSLAQKAIENAAISRMTAEFKKAEVQELQAFVHTTPYVKVLDFASSEGSKVVGDEVPLDGGDNANSVQDDEIDLLELTQSIQSIQNNEIEGDTEEDVGFHVPENPYAVMTEGDAAIRSATQIVPGLSSCEGPVAYAANQPKPDPRRTKLEINTERAMQSSFEEHGLRLDQIQGFPRLGTPSSFAKLEEDNGDALHREAQQDVVECRREQRALGQRYWARGASRGNDAWLTPASSGPITPILPFHAQSPQILSLSTSMSETAVPKAPFQAVATATTASSSTANPRAKDVSLALLKFIESEDDDWMTQFVAELREGQPVRNYAVEWQEWEDIMFPQTTVVKPPRKPRLTTQLREAEKEQKKQKPKAQPKKKTEKEKKEKKAKQPSTRTTKKPSGTTTSRKRRAGAEGESSSQAKRARLDAIPEKEEQKQPEPERDLARASNSPVEVIPTVVDMDSVPSKPATTSRGGKARGGRGSRGGRGRGRRRGGAA
ncbi:hypothetical protein BROUX41_001069 [Berkeleyomyces rouxiae]